MAHARQQIRSAIESVLTGLTTTSTRVFASRVYPYDQVPCLGIWTTEDEQMLDAQTSTKQTRALTVMIEGRAKVNNTIDDTLDTIAAEVEAAIGTDDTIGGVVKRCDLIRTEIEIEDGAERPSGVVRMTWQAIYRTAKNDATTIIP